MFVDSYVSPKRYLCDAAKCPLETVLGSQSAQPPAIVIKSPEALQQSADMSQHLV